MEVYGMYSVSDIKLGEMKRYRFMHNNRELDVIGVCVDVLPAASGYTVGAWCVLYGYAQDGTTYNEIKFGLSNLIEIKTVRLPAGDKSRENLEKQEYNKAKEYREQIKEAEIRVRAMEKKYRDQMVKTDNIISLIMNKRGVMPVKEFTAMIHGLIEEKVKARCVKTYSNMYVSIEGDRKHLNICVSMRVGRYNYGDMVRSGIAYREYDDNVFVNPYKDIQNNTLVKKWVNENKLYWKLSKLGAVEYHDIEIGDKCWVYVDSGVRIPLKKGLSAEYAKEIAANII